MHLVVALCCDTKLDKYTNAMYTACTVPFRPCIDEQHTHKHLCVRDACDWVWAHVRLIKVLFNMQLHSPTEYQLRVATSPSRHYFFVFVLLHSMQWHVLIHTCTQSHGAMKQTGASQSIDTQSVWYVFALCCGHSDTFCESFFFFFRKRKYTRSPSLALVACRAGLPHKRQAQPLKPGPMHFHVAGASHGVNDPPSCCVHIVNSVNKQRMLYICTISIAVCTFCKCVLCVCTIIARLF